MDLIIKRNYLNELFKIQSGIGNIKSVKWLIIFYKCSNEPPFKISYLFKVWLNDRIYTFFTKQMKNDQISLTSISGPLDPLV